MTNWIAPGKTQQTQAGFTVLEAAVAALLGAIVLGGAIAFLNSSTKTMHIGQENTVITGKGQQALSRMTREIKSVNTNAPPLFNVTPDWATLPALPYTALELTPYPATAGVVLIPAVPAARFFATQTSPGDPYHKWYPNPDDQIISNSLVFYKAPAPGPGGTAQVQRITYRHDASRQSLVREVQVPLTASSTSFSSNPTPDVTVLSNRVKAVQFTYPSFEQAMTPSLDSDLDALLSAEGNAVLQRFLNENYRKAIGIRLLMEGPVHGNKSYGGVELTTEVRLRNE